VVAAPRSPARRGALRHGRLPRRARRVRRGEAPGPARVPEPLPRSDGRAEACKTNNPLCIG